MAVPPCAGFSALNRRISTLRRRSRRKQGRPGRRGRGNGKLEGGVAVQSAGCKWPSARLDSVQAWRFPFCLLPLCLQSAGSGAQHLLHPQTARSFPPCRRWRRSAEGGSGEASGEGAPGCLHAGSGHGSPCSEKAEQLSFFCVLVNFQTVAICHSEAASAACSLLPAAPAHR